MTNSIHQATKTTVRFYPKKAHVFNKNKPDNLKDLDDQILIDELEHFIAAHEAAGIEFDSDGQELIYSEDLTVTIMRGIDGIWYIIDFIFEWAYRKITGYKVVYTIKTFITKTAVKIQKLFAGFTPIRKPSYVGLRGLFYNRV